VSIVPRAEATAESIALRLGRFEIRDVVEIFGGVRFAAVLARKPLEGTVAGNVAKWGCGGVAIERSRISFVSTADAAETKEKNKHADFGSGPMTNNVFGKFKEDRTNYAPTGRWPANVTFSDASSVALLAQQSGLLKSGAITQGATLLPRKNPTVWSSFGAHVQPVSRPSNEGTADRFFLRADLREQVAYFAKLIAPPGAILFLDPFMRGSVLQEVAAAEGWAFVGVAP
jgi:site-specific DNA-methyltransferase (adenine-specific)